MVTRHRSGNNNSFWWRIALFGTATLAVLAAIIYRFNSNATSSNTLMLNNENRLGNLQPKTVPPLPQTSNVYRPLFRIQKILHKSENSGRV